MTTATHRGTTNRNQRGSSEARRIRRQYLVDTYRADVDLLAITTTSGHRFTAIDSEGNRSSAELNGATIEVVAACRCYRCGELLSVDTVTSDRIKPGCLGGTYRRENIRPCCVSCNSSTGGSLGNARKRAAVKS